MDFAEKIKGLNFTSSTRKKSRMYESMCDIASSRDTSPEVKEELMRTKQQFDEKT